MGDEFLTEDEQRIESDETVLRPASQEKKQRVEQILARAKKSQAISIRLSSYDLAKLKETAEREGIPYQTLINSVLHKYVSHQLYDKNELLKTLTVAKDAM